jgi:Ni/Co efflux regulator RcnB
MLKSRTMAIAGTIAALSLAATPIASASVDTHSGKPSPDRIQRVEKRSPDKTNSPDRTNSHDRNAQRDSTNHR